MTEQQGFDTDFRDGIQQAFRFVKKEILREENNLPKPEWHGFTEDDMFDSIMTATSRTGYTDDGDSEVSRIVSFRLGGVVVATVMLDGIRTPWESTWKVVRVIYRCSWHPMTGEGRGVTIHDIDVSDGAYANSALVDA